MRMTAYQNYPSQNAAQCASMSTHITTDSDKLRKTSAVTTGSQMQQRDLEPSASVPAYFGAELRRLRKAAGLTQEELGERINYTGALIGMIETTLRTPTLQFAEMCDRVLETGGVFARLWPLVIKPIHPSWFRGYVELEATATQIRSFQCQLVPGLLQTEAYARAVFRIRPERYTAEEIDELVIARTTRQVVLAASRGPMCWFILDEAILHRPVGGREVMRAQLAHLLDFADHPNVMIQVVPFEAGEYPGLDGALTILSFVEGPDVAYTESHADVAMLIHSQDQVSTCTLAYDFVRSVALSPKLSAELISKAMEQL
jgi:transcriptional regulator with XRE-family HTH domain